MSARRYDIRRGTELGAAAYAVTGLAQLAEDPAHPEQVREYAQRTLDEMVALGFIEPRDEKQS